MPDSEQARMINAIGEAIVEDPNVERVEWQALAFVATILDGQEQMTGYRYTGDGGFEALRLRGFGDVLDQLMELREAMQAEAGAAPWSQCLIQITKPDYALKLTYEYENPERWRPRKVGLDMSEFAGSLRPA